MQIKNSPSFIKSFMVGLIASSAGAFVALPSAAMPEATEVGSETEAIAPEVITEPAAVDTLPEPEMDAAEGEISTEADALTEADPIAEEAITDEAVEEPAIADEAVEEPIAEEALTDDAAMEEPIAEEALTDDAAMEESLAEEALTDEVEAPVAEESLEEPTEEAAAEEMNTDEFTITELTGSSDSFEILAAALEAAELTEVLSSEGPYTVFAPTDEAFEALPEGAIEQLLLPENQAVLIQVLTYHVIPGALLSTDLETGAVATVEGSELAVEVAETVTVNNANVIATDVTASNGVIHVIDSVILPPAPEADAEVEAEDEAAADAEVEAEDELSSAQ